LRRAFQWPAIAAIVLMIGLAFSGVYQHPFAMVSFGMCLFVTVTVAMEFFKGGRAISTKSNIGFVPALIELTHRNTRRYGGYIVHMAIVVMFIGFTGAAFNKERTVEVGKGSAFDIGRYTLKVADMQDGENDNYVWSRMTLDVFVGNHQISTLAPEKRFYKASRSQASEVAIRRRLNEDLYVNYAGVNDNQRAVIQAYVNPLVSWVWIGYYVLLGGTLICLVPSKIKLAYARTQVVGITKKHVTVEK
jgi:cytochrome c-type biogenesis protein CcmF